MSETRRNHVRSQREDRKKTKKKSWLKRILWIVLALFLIVVIIGAYMLFNVYNASKHSYEGLDRPGEKSALRDQDVKLGKDPITILIEGIEDYSTGGKNGRGDALILATLNPKTKKMTMTSIPRDTRVKIEKAKGKKDWHKINAAHAFGGNKLEVETIEKMMNVPIDKYVAVDFKGFRDVVDTLGGVDIDVKYPFWEKDAFNHDKHINFKQGKQHMDGEKGLAFVRMRKRAVNAKYSRDERQRQFLRATLKQAISAGTIFKVDDISDILGKHVKTNLSPREIYSLEKMYSSMDTSDINTVHIDGRDQTVGGVSYYIPDADSLDKTSKQLRKSLGLDPDGGSQSSNAATSDDLGIEGNQQSPQNGQSDQPQGNQGNPQQGNQGSPQQGNSQERQGNQQGNQGTQGGQGNTQGNSGY